MPWNTLQKVGPVVCMWSTVQQAGTGVDKHRDVGVHAAAEIIIFPPRPESFQPHVVRAHRTPPVFLRTLRSEYRRDHFHFSTNTVNSKSRETILEPTSGFRSCIELFSLANEGDE